MAKVVGERLIIEKGVVTYVYETDDVFNVESDVELLAFDNLDFEKALKRAIYELKKISKEFKITLTIQ